jgi:hypothetical protein
MYEPENETTLMIELYFAESVLDRDVFARVWAKLGTTPISTTWFGRATPRKHRFAEGADTAFKILFGEHHLSFGDRKGAFGSSRLNAGIYRDHTGLTDLHVFVRGASSDSRWLEWIVALCDAVPMLFGFACALADHDRKHAVVTEYIQGRRHGSTGSSRPELYEFLPGVYWLTLLGPQLAAALDVARAAALPGVTVRELAHGQRAIVAGDSPFDDNAARREHERAIAAALGDDFFFDRDRTDRTLHAVPAFADALAQLKNT